MTKEDFIQWQSNPVTRGAFSAIANAATLIAGQLINRTTANSEQDMYQRGFIRGIQEVIDWVPEFDEPKLEESLENEFQSEGSQSTY